MNENEDIQCLMMSVPGIFNGNYEHMTQIPFLVPFPLRMVFCNTTLKSTLDRTYRTVDKINITSRQIQMIDKNLHRIKHIPRVLQSAA